MERLDIGVAGRRGRGGAERHRRRRRGASGPCARRAIHRSWSTRPPAESRPSAAASHDSSHLSVHSARPPAARPSTRCSPTATMHTRGQSDRKCLRRGAPPTTPKLPCRARGRAARDGAVPPANGKHKLWRQSTAVSVWCDLRGGWPVTAGDHHDHGPLGGGLAARAMSLMLGARLQHLHVAEHAVVKLLRVAARVGPAAVDEHPAVGHCNRAVRQRARRVKGARSARRVRGRGARARSTAAAATGRAPRSRTAPATAARAQAARRRGAWRGLSSRSGGRRFQRRAHRARHVASPPAATCSSRQQRASRASVTSSSTRSSSSKTSSSSGSRQRRRAVGLQRRQPLELRPRIVARRRGPAWLEPRTLARGPRSRPRAGASAAVRAGGAGSGGARGGRTRCRSRCTVVSSASSVGWRDCARPARRRSAAPAAL